MMLGFYIRDYQDYERFKKDSLSFTTGNTPLFSIIPEKPVFDDVGIISASDISDTTGCDTTGNDTSDFN
jgi:hypothetical protein